MIFFEHNKNGLKRLSCLTVILLFSFFSLGAWWDFGTPKKKEPSKDKEIPEWTAPSEISEPEPAGLPDEKESAETEDKEKAKDKTGKITENREEVEKLQKDLKEVISRTQQLQGQVQGNRTEIQGILERAQIHERILRSMSVPRPIQLKSQVDAEELVKREKVRLIAEQTQRTQQQLRVIQQMKSIPKTPKTS